MLIDMLIKSFAAIVLVFTGSLLIMSTMLLLYWIGAWILLQIMLIAEVVGSWFLLVVFLAFVWIVYLSYRYLNLR